MRTCNSCRFATDIKFGDDDVKVCTGAPPTAVPATRPTDPPTLTLSAWYPPVPNKPCGMYRRRRWWHR